MGWWFPIPNPKGIIPQDQTLMYSEIRNPSILRRHQNHKFVYFTQRCFHANHSLRQFLDDIDKQYTYSIYVCVNVDNKDLPLGHPFFTYFSKHSLVAILGHMQSFENMIHIMHWQYNVPYLSAKLMGLHGIQGNTIIMTLPYLPQSRMEVHPPRPEGSQLTVTQRL